jgi:succinate dehydrogenase/fumarate reductase flavoprotein subunit
MATTEQDEPGVIPPELLAEMQEAADRAAQGVRDPEAMRQACERMDQISEQVRRKHGVLDIGTPAIRELREAE